MYNAGIQFQLERIPLYIREDGLRKLTLTLDKDRRKAKNHLRSSDFTGITSLITQVQHLQNLFSAHGRQLHKPCLLFQPIMRLLVLAVERTSPTLLTPTRWYSHSSCMICSKKLWNEVLKKPFRGPHAAPVSKSIIRISSRTPSYLISLAWRNTNPLNVNSFGITLKESPEGTITVSSFKGFNMYDL